MPSPIAHSATAYFLYKITPQNNRSIHLNRHRWIDLAYIIVIGNIADLDFIPHLILEGSFHRGPSHSLCIALLISIGCTLIFKWLHQSTFQRLFLLTFGIYISHLFLDFWTAGGSGMKLLWPFTNAFIKSPIAFFPSVRHSEGLFYPGHIVFMTFETIYSVVLLVFINRYQKYKRQNQNT
ncbi:metal-dependent hydrolase [Acaryochloris marina]|uniref:metal-dependent hydrolase n=1 Tax=Acaryochloris marina TaxID=155978 RepID=UPI001BAFF5BC|nr:metal-dependent hydrolase [Acaryochloris marina]QUY42264.1 metal-dependent hydrolase [Acaryochloris marina S15]